MCVVPADYIKWLGLWLCLWLVPAQAELPPLTHNLIPVSESRSAPDLRLPDMDDEIVDIRSLKGKVVVVNFWATWCPPCRREMPSLEQLYQATKERGVVVLAVNIGEDVDAIFPFLGRVEPSPSFPILLDSDSSSPSAWKVRGLPTTFVVAPDGTLAFQAVGGREFSHPDLIKQLMSLFEEGSIK
ncbi:MAG: TlpA disulfide reductase family protein [Candidatus Thiodiazotropha endolucinida]|uniref:Thiol-disulfide oxidoreductase ResA n=2 Tax=Candidatus Thiodiazotropha TaxID=1913444 RepID=A0A7Z0VI33_9GAMM|nr:TlpA disulfide reductase family protein [Candidatus Thiodiazotropha endolucinida]MBT3040830.1 TlpA family protein disulfide reductase [Candidatus Thiodiazotropha sp. (ex Codakia orbicularis)]MCG7979680.1 TlpA family protein disulfide reductase [Candidatus Thiodiazotropha taylori]MCW4237811.1 TlpA family protein disulfide reductase [Candidatus Thiodiazotropha endolucinida]ODJ85995.1 thiol-disulfide oxidoreductase ResA [Candidatus Thiodiazotropha endolucinida]